MERIHRIEYMEQVLNRAEESLKLLDKAMESYENIRQQLRELIEYYESPQWMEDFQADEQGLLPQDLKRGVLSEDAVYNLLTERLQILRVWQKWIEEDMPC